MTHAACASLFVQTFARAILAGVGVLALLAPATAHAADQVGGKAGAVPPEVQTLPVINVPPVDPAAVAIEDTEDREAGLAPRFAIPNQVFVTPDNDGDWEQVRGDTWVWRLRINSPGAVSLNLGFTRYFMPEGGSLVIRSADGTRSIRPFTAEDNATHGELWTPVLPSDDIVVELTIPDAVTHLLHLELTSINVGYRRFGGGGGGPIESGACNIDVVCPEGDLWRDEIPSVGVISTGGARFCTGSMINNTSQNQTPYFLTANHCTITSGNAASLVVFWNYETTTCGGTPNGSSADFQTGSFFRAAYTPSDFTLVELDSAPLPAWGVTFAGWDRSGANASSAVAIHHPNVDEKRISFENQATSTTSYSSTAVPGDGTHVRITDWDLGTTEGGSSGSPLFDQNHRVIGQLHGGGAACGNNSSDWYGKLAVSWNGGGASSSRLSNWLDPTNTGATTVNTLVPGAVGCTVNLDCDDGLFCNGAETCVASSCQAGSDPCPGQSCDEATNLCVAGPAVVYSWNMNTNPGWTMQGQWAWGSPTGGGGQHAGPDPTTGATGTNVVGYNLAGDYANNLAETHLTTTAIDCTNLINTSVRFQRWLGVEQPTYDHAYVRVSNNGTTWTTLWQNTAEVGDTSWSQFTYDISAVADGQATVFVRWTIGTTDSSWQYCGWNIDDVEIVATDLGGGATCSDGILNQGEDRIDCGGPCLACACISDAACDNGVFCDGTETCDAFGVCQVGTAVNCNDAVACTDDACNEVTNSCDNTANNANCDNGLFCDGSETCNAVSDCQVGTAVNCNDAVACTDDSCNEATNSCDNIANNANCDDGLACNGAETCDAALDCQAGTAVNCSDAVACTDDSCSEPSGTCNNVANNANCDNGLFCDGAETCDALLDCQVGTAVNCNDGIGCTTDSCNETTNACDNTPSNAVCDDGLFCNGAETCSATLDCQAGGDPCPGQICDEVGNVCVNCVVNADCDDGLFCNGAETCAAGVCQAGTAVNCSDGVVCTDDSCNEVTNTCDSVANNANCDNGLFCDGVETCSATLDCQAGTAVNCNDGVGCTTDSCNETTNACDNTPDNVACDDGLFCNGAETCSATLDCQLGGDPCPGQTCDEVTNTCSGGGCTINADCDDANACTVDTCSAGVCTNACSSSVSVFPYAENFEVGFGLWSNVTGDVFDWTRRSGSTPSSNTGPTGDHTSGAGFYVFTETSSPRVAGDTALLEGPCLDLSGTSSATFSFWYNMNGASMGTLDVEVSTDCTVWTNAFTLSGNQGNTWTQSSIDLTAYAGSSSVKLRFRGTRGSSWQGDIAVDDISVTVVAASNCTINADCDDANVCTDDTCVGGVCQNANNVAACTDGLFCNGADVCSAGACVPVIGAGVANGTFDGAASWTSNTAAGGSITYPANLNVVGTDAGAVGFTWASQGSIAVNGANLEFDLLSYLSSDTGSWDYPVFYLDGTYYGLNQNGTLGAATTGGTGGAGTVDNGGQVSVAIHYIVNIDAVAGNAGPHTIGFGVHSVDGGFGAGTAVYDTVLPAGGPPNPCPGQTCDEVNDVCVP